MTNRKPSPTHYIVSTDESNSGDAFLDRDVARRIFDTIAAKGKRVRLLLVERGKASELDRRNS